MLGLYIYTLILSHKKDKKCVFGQKRKNTTTTKQKIKHKNPCMGLGLNPGPLAPKADALPLHSTESIDCSQAI